MSKGRKLEKFKIYNKVDNSTRLKLVKLVENKKTKLKDASNILGINYSTVKTIMRLYRTENRIYRKKKGGNLRKKNQTNKKSPKPRKIKISSIKNEEDTFSTTHLEVISTTSANCKKTDDTQKHTSDLKNVICPILEKNQQSPLLEDSNNIKSLQKSENIINDIAYYYIEKCKLLKEINQNYFFMYNYMALKQLWNRHSSVQSIPSS